MKTPVVDYRTFRLSKLRHPEFSHIGLLLGWVLYFISYFITENLIPVSACHVIHSPLDDLIPFREVFVIPYVLWYFLVAGSLLYFFLYDIPSFRYLMKYIIAMQIIATVIYVLYPSCQMLRPVEFPRENIFTAAIGFLYSLDTNTNVFPSLHVGLSLGILSVWLKAKGAHGLWKGFVTVLVILICLSTTFIKQHSVLDGIAAIVIGIFVEGFVFCHYYREKFNRRRNTP